MKTIRNTVSSSVIAQIPSNTAGRRNFLKQQLRIYAGDSEYCAAVGANVEILPKSIKETAQWAGKSRKSTIAALNLKSVIRHATFSNSDKPKSGTQTTKFHFKRTYILYTEIKNLGVAKLTIGKDRNKVFVHYCVSCK
ncbi:MAG: hypothetical protein IKX51_08775 [Bacteroidales bacterium]|nr:hypothetical protein [Bacteroidales bacterium]